MSGHTRGGAGGAGTDLNLPTLTTHSTWNFGAKFLVDREGNVVTRFKGNPADKEALIKELLSVKAFL